MIDEARKKVNDAPICFQDGVLTKHIAVTEHNRNEMVKSLVLNGPKVHVLDACFQANDYTNRVCVTAPSECNTPCTCAVRHSLPVLTIGRDAFDVLDNMFGYEMLTLADNRTIADIDMGHYNLTVTTTTDDLHGASSSTVTKSEHILVSDTVMYHISLGNVTGTTVDMDFCVFSNAVRRPRRQHHLASSKVVVV